MTIAYPGLAHAQTVADPDYWRQTPERQATVNRLVYSQSPQAIPGSYDSVREAEQILRENVRELPPSNPQARSLWTAIRETTATVKLSPAMRALGTIGLAVGAFDIGWRIGTGINAKFLKIGVPEASQASSTYSRRPAAAACSAPSTRRRTAG